MADGDLGEEIAAFVGTVDRFRAFNTISSGLGPSNAEDAGELSVGDGGRMCFGLRFFFSAGSLLAPVPTKRFCLSALLRLPSERPTLS